jgi:hypothetical protein
VQHTKKVKKEKNRAWAVKCLESKAFIRRANIHSQGIQINANIYLSPDQENSWGIF